MAQAENTTISALRTALVEAAEQNSVETARKAIKDAHDHEERQAGLLAYYDALATETYQRLPDGVRHVIGRKLIPGLREVNRELRQAIGKHVELWVEGADDNQRLTKVSLEPAKMPTCTNCGAEYPDGATQCPACGVP